HTSTASDAGELHVKVTEPDEWPLRKTRITCPDSLCAAQPFTTLTVGNMGLDGEWDGRVYLFDVASHDSLERRLHFLEALIDHITPGLTNLFLLRRLRSQASAAERARVARELHDGTIQALFGIEMKIEALRRAPALNPSA